MGSKAFNGRREGDFAFLGSSQVSRPATPSPNPRNLFASQSPTELVETAQPLQASVPSPAHSQFDHGPSMLSPMAPSSPLTPPPASQQLPMAVSPTPHGRINLPPLNLAEHSADGILGEHGYRLRPRRDIQKHPFLLEQARYDRQLAGIPDAKVKPRHLKLSRRDEEEDYDGGTQGVEGLDGDNEDGLPLTCRKLPPELDGQGGIETSNWLPEILRESLSSDEDEDKEMHGLAKEARRERKTKKVKPRAKARSFPLPATSPRPSQRNPEVSHICQILDRKVGVFMVTHSTLRRILGMHIVATSLLRLLTLCIVRRPQVLGTARAPHPLTCYPRTSSPWS